MKEEQIITHESFAQVQFSRVTGGNKSFYGSELPQDHYIVLRILPSQLHRTITEDRYFPKLSPIIEVKMTTLQFSELITSMNINSGVPCTITRFNGKDVEQYSEIENRKEYVHQELQNKFNQFSSTLEEDKTKIKELLKKKTLSKQDAIDIEKHLSFITREVKDNIPYLTKCFQETMDKIVLEAKMEVEAAILHKVTTLGLNALQEQNKLLNE